MRVLIVDTYYPAFLETHYDTAPTLAEDSYEQQWRALMSMFFGTADAYSHHLKLLGHEAAEVVINCRPLQAAWAREHGLPETADGEEILLAQARSFEPDVVYVQHVHYLSDETLDRLRRLARALVGQIATEPPRPERLRRFDLIVTSMPHFLERFRSGGANVAFLRLGFDERALRAVEAEQQPRDRLGAVFVGSLGRTQHFRSNATVARAARSAPIEFWGYAERYWPPWSPVKRRFHGPAWGIDMYRILHASRIAVNRHGGIAGDHAINMRLYEATGMGTLLLTETKGDLADVFRPASEVETYASASELAEKVAYYLDHDEERRAIARAGQERTLRDHTYAQRMSELADLLGGLRG